MAEQTPNPGLRIAAIASRKARPLLLAGAALGTAALVSLIALRAVSVAVLPSPLLKPVVAAPTSWVIAIGEEIAASVAGEGDAATTDSAAAAPAPSVDVLLAEAEAQGFRLSDVRSGLVEVPRLFLAALPPDLPDVSAAEKRKRVFIKALLPLILKANEAITLERERLLDIAAAMAIGIAPDAGDRAWLAELADRYGVGDPLNVAELKRRVDIVPPSLALAQAAEESGWGTSKLAHAGKSLFGQSAWLAPDGSTAEEGADGVRYGMVRFEALEASVQAYMRNLNTHNAYRQFRERRAGLRAERSTVDGHALAGTLQRYSTRGEEYIETIRKIMRVNEFRQFDAARLSETVPPAEPPFRTAERF